MIRESVAEKILKEKIIAIIRGMDYTSCPRIARSLCEGGIHLMEVTFNLSDPQSFERTAQAIRATCSALGGESLVGAGTVVSPALTELAAEAGARYIISPDCNTEVIRRTKELGLISIPGAMTPTEILRAVDAGADFVKIFPAGTLGSAFIKAVSAPISHVGLLAVGGIHQRNMGEFLKAGVAGFGIGGNLVQKEWVAKGEFNKITQAAKGYVAALSV